MNLGPAFRTAYRSYVARPSEVLPFYFLGTAVPAVVRTLPLLGLFVGYLLLARQGRLGELQSALESLGPIPLDDPEATTNTPPGSDETAAVDTIVDVLQTPEVLGPLVLSLALGLLLVLVLNAAITAGQVHALLAVLTGRPGVRAAVDGSFRHAATFVALLVAELVAYAVLVVGLSIAVALAVAVSTGLGVLAAVLAGFVGIVAAAAIRLVFAFAPIAAVVDGVGTVGALRGTTGYVRRRPVEAVGYGILSLVVLVGVGIVGGLFGVLGAGAVAPLLGLLVAAPVLDLLKTALYGGDDEGTTLQPPTAPGSGVAERLRSELTGGGRELIRFVRGHPALVGVSVLAFAGGVYGGWAWTAGLEGVFEASIERRLAETGPVGSFFEYAANNWQVAVAQSFAGLAFGVPTLLSLGLNGMLFGAFLRFEVAPALLLAFVAPHGIVEIPALIVSGGLGLYLGVVAARYAGGSADRDDLAAAIKRAYAVVVGLAILFVVAALVEAFVSPYYWRLFW